MEDRFRVRGWSVFDSGYYDDIQNMLFGVENNMTLLDAISKGLVNEIIPEQCTGLEDKKGKLIYEGDIVETHDYTTEHSQIVFDKGCYVLKSKDVAIYDHLSSYEKQCEIIGNIHENPELLEEK